LTPFLSGLAGGLSVTAWQELVAKTIPANRRASLWASRYIVSALIGLGAGFAVKAVLRVWPGTVGYGILHLCTFFFLLLSYIVFCSIRETSLPPKKARHGQSFVQYLATLPVLVHGDKRLALYMPVKVLSASAFIVYSFLSAHVLAALDHSESFLGALLIAQMAGILVGNLAGGRMGNRLGGKTVLLSGYLCFLTMTLLAFRFVGDWQAYVVFFLFGVSFSLDRVGSMTFDMDMAPIQQRVAYFAVLGVVKLAGLLLASILGPAWRAYAAHVARDAGWVFPLMSLPILLCMAVSLGLLLLVREPRHTMGQGQ
jgi:predicted MFS family arabinose efflux permease